MLTAKQDAPFFEAQDQNQEWLHLADYQGYKNVVLYFYPKDDTPGCTLEAQQFTALASEFEALDTVILGVSKDSCDSHKAFAEKYGLTVRLLADPSGEICERYGVWQEREKDGVKKMAILRSTFILNKEGVIEDAQYGVNPDGHAAAVLARIRELSEAA